MWSLIGSLSVSVVMLLISLQKRFTIATNAGADDDTGFYSENKTPATRSHYFT